MPAKAKTLRERGLDPATCWPSWRIGEQANFSPYCGGRESVARRWHELRPGLSPQLGVLSRGVLPQQVVHGCLSLRQAERVNPRLTAYVNCNPCSAPILQELSKEQPGSLYPTPQKAYTRLPALTRQSSQSRSTQPALLQATVFPCLDNLNQHFLAQRKKLILPSQPRRPNRSIKHGHNPNPPV